MKTKFFVLAVSMLTALSLSSCYTEFATTGNENGYSYQGNSPEYYDSTYSGNSYDTMGTPMINNYYNYYGYSYPWYDYNNWYTPSPWWWQSDLWLNFGWGLNPWYGVGFGWGWPYYSGALYGYSSYYSPYFGYSPFYPYGLGYYHQNGAVNPAGRVRTIGDTRDGRESYGGGSTPVPYTPSTGNVSGTGSTGTAGAGVAASREPAPAERTRSSNVNATSSSTNTQPATRTRDNGASTQQQPSSTPQPQSQPAPEQPRVRDSGPSRGDDSGNNSSGNQPRGRSGTAYSRNTSGSHRVMWGSRQSYRVMRATQRIEMQYAQPSRAPMLQMSRVQNAPRWSTPSMSSFRETSPAASAPARSSGGGRARR